MPRGEEWVRAAKRARANKAKARRNRAGKRDPWRAAQPVAIKQPPKREEQ